jgi:hypothetical protein
MLFDLTFPCYLTTYSGKKCLSGKIICAFFCPAYRSSPVDEYVFLNGVPRDSQIEAPAEVAVPELFLKHIYMICMCISV